MSQMLRNFPAVSETTEPALRIMGKTDPHDPLDPEKKTMSQTSGNFQIPGYSGFVPGVQARRDPAPRPLPSALLAPPPLSPPPPPSSGVAVARMGFETAVP